MQNAPMAAFLVCINADPAGSLGGSVERDIANVQKSLSNIFHNSEYSLSCSLKQYAQIRNRVDMKSVAHNVKLDIKSYRATQLAKGCAPRVMIFLYISGHGYQVTDVSGDEAATDGKDECIHLQDGTVLDDELKATFVTGMAGYYDCVLCVADTCHSGSMLDLARTWDAPTRKWTPEFSGREGDAAFTDTKPFAFCVSACVDAGAASCDIGNTLGFGGALTLKLLETKFANTNISLLCAFVEKLIVYYATHVAFPLSTFQYALSKCSAELTAAYGQKIVCSYE